MLVAVRELCVVAMVSRSPAKEFNSLQLAAHAGTTKSECRLVAQRAESSWTRRRCGGMRLCAAASRARAKLSVAGHAERIKSL